MGAKLAPASSESQVESDLQQASSKENDSNIESMSLSIDEREQALEGGVQQAVASSRSLDIELRQAASEESDPNISSSNLSINEKEPDYD